MLKILIALVFLTGCSPYYQLQRVNDSIYPHFEYVSDMKRYGVEDYTGSYMERWDIDGKMRGDCDEYAAEAYMRAKAEGLSVYKQRFHCHNKDGKLVGHITVRLGGKVYQDTDYLIHNQSMWVETVNELKARDCWPIIE